MNTQKTELSVAGRTFEDSKQINDHSAEHWSARDLRPLPGYRPRRRFGQAQGMWE
ncbi:MAG: hypothetical protein LBD68_03865 [Zoogloeaceae bacterium]|jgi:DNA-damage-inducible protein D|nr:hypothetical protein [Zoogloeaceae bacterium]